MNHDMCTYTREQVILSHCTKYTHILANPCVWYKGELNITVEFLLVYVFNTWTHSSNKILDESPSLFLFYALHNMYLVNIFRVCYIYLDIYIMILIQFGKLIINNLWIEDSTSKNFFYCGPITREIFCLKLRTNIL